MHIKIAELRNYIRFSSLRIISTLNTDKKESKHKRKR